MAPLHPQPKTSSGGAAACLQRWLAEGDCAACAGLLADQLKPLLHLQQSVIVELRGTLGAGKTTFTRHLLRALGVTGRVKSPSYAVVEPHEALGQTLWHFDFYRFAEPSEWEDAGFRDVFAGPGLKLVEWPDQAAGLLPPADLRLDLEVAAEATEPRQLRWRADTPAGQAILAAWGLA